MPNLANIAELTRLLEAAPQDPDHVHTPGVFVDTVVACRPRTKDIERVVHRRRPEADRVEEGAR